MNYEKEIAQSVQYLASDQAQRSLQRDAYWPKWDSPWWHMLLLFEMGEVKRIPKAAVEAHVAAMARIPLKIFPLRAGDLPEGVDPHRGYPCHCQLGNVYRVLAAWGVDVDLELPWIRPWFLNYQMADGGMNCDNDAYLVQDEVPSSMVGIIAAFEAILLHTRRPWTPQETQFLDRGAQFLIGRRLIEGSATRHNASERKSAAEDWLRPCFPRFYLYDVLRGLNALLLWGEKRHQTVPVEAIGEVVAYLERCFPDGKVVKQRLSFAGAGTRLPDSSGEWKYVPSASLFPLLNKVSALHEPSPFLTQQWQECRARLGDASK